MGHKSSKQAKATKCIPSTDKIVVPEGQLMPEEVINLDLPPRDRWREVGMKYKQEIQETVKILNQQVPQEAIDLIETFGHLLDSLLPPPYAEELLGLAEVTEVPVGELFLFNLAYDITACCTSTIEQANDGTLLHGRNLDLPLEFQSIMKIARTAVFNANFRRKGQTVYSAVFNAGAIGTFTGQKPNSFTISINERRTGNFWTNILSLLLESPGSAISFLIRDALADPDIDYQGVLNRMKYIPMIASCYVIIAGTNLGEGVVITRDRQHVVEPLNHGVWKLDANAGRWHLLQTNNDHWTAPPHLEPPGGHVEFSYQRQMTGDETMNRIGRKNVSPQSLIDVLSTPPVFFAETLYTTVMSAADPSLNKSWIRDKK